MTEPCNYCRNLTIDIAQKKAELGRTARIASRKDHPRYVEAANRAKAAYVRARDDQMTHAATHDRVDA